MTALPSRVDDDLTLIAGAVRAAGDMALEQAKEGVKSWEKSPGHPVTRIDFAVDDILRRQLRGARPDYGWLSEESADDRSRLSSPRSFLVDPIDGTRDLMRGRRGWAVSVAVVEGDRPVRAALFAPALDEFFTASEGEGAQLGGAPIATSGQTDLAAARLCIDADTLRSRHWAGPSCEAVYKPNSIALRIANVAAGRADATFDGRESREYDTAAAALILAEAGGILTDTDGRAARYNKPQPIERNLIASATPELHAELREVFAETLNRWRARRK